MLYIGVDLGGTGIKAGVVNERGEILSKGSTPTMKERPYQAIIRDIAALCEDVAKQANVAMADIAAIGVGVPGICDPKTGIIPFCTNLGWHEVPFVAEMGKYLPNRVVVDNDATVAGYAESIAGVSKGTKSSVFITLGTGVGGGIVINPGAYAHYSYAIYDALRCAPVPAVEVHISDINAREPFRAVSVTAPACVRVITGHGLAGYLEAMDYLLQHTNDTAAAPTCGCTGEALV